MWRRSRTAELSASDAPTDPEDLVDPQTATRAEQLLGRPEAVEQLKTVLGQIQEHYEGMRQDGSTLWPAFSGITPSGRLIECTLWSPKGDTTSETSVNVFTYDLGTELSGNIIPREVEYSSIKSRGGSSSILLRSDEYPRPDASASSMERFLWKSRDAEVIIIQDLYFNLQGDTSSLVSYGHGTNSGAFQDSPHEPYEPVVPLSHYTELAT